MWKINLAVAASTLFMACGCMQGTPGGPGVQTQPAKTTQTVDKSVNSGPHGTVAETTVKQTHEAAKPVITDSKDTFSLRVPVLATAIKQGELKTMTISIQRGSEFADDVNLQFASIPAGITINPSAPVIMQSDKEVKLEITAADTAPVGEFSVKVMGHPMKSGQDAENEFKLHVEAK
jgi:hypothetical protein